VKDQIVLLYMIAFVPWRQSLWQMLNKHTAIPCSEEYCYGTYLGDRNCSERKASYRGL